ncbi:MAG: DUF6531 domain-containing protein, partial [Candidatus Methylomirabilota bacterium]
MRFWFLPLPATIALLLVLVVPAAPAARRDPAPIPDEAVHTLVREPLTRRGASLPRVFRAHLAQTLALLERIGAEEGRGADLSATSRMLLEGKLHELQAAWAELEVQFGTIRQDFARGGGVQAERAWGAKIARLRVKFAGIREALAAILGSHRLQDRRHAREVLARELRRFRAKVAEQDGAIHLPPLPTLRPAQPVFQRPEREPAPVPQYARYPAHPGTLYASAERMLAQAPPSPAANVCTYTQADLTPTVDAPITQEIRDLAAFLGHSPTRIYEYVANEVAFEPYYGSLKGAIGTLYSRAGNATDHASLLIALLRASGFPSRYVMGVVVFNQDPRILAWLGVKSYEAAANVLNAGRIPAEWSGSSVWFWHVWAEACVPFGAYRGLGVGLGGYRWVPLDASFKEMTYQPGIAVATPMDYGTGPSDYMGKRSTVLPHEKYMELVEADIKQQNPNATLGDVPYKGTLVPRRVDVLPVSPPYDVYNFWPWVTGPSAETADLPSGHRYSLQIEIRNGTGSPIIAPTLLAYPEVALQRITVSYQGASSADTALLQQWRTQSPMSADPPCGIAVVPVIRVEGVQRAVGTGSVDLCDFSSTMTLRLTVDELEPFYGSPAPTLINEAQIALRAANAYAIQAYAFQASDRLLSERAAKLLASVRAIGNPNATPEGQEETEGEFLHLVGLKYMRYLTDAYRAVGQLRGETGWAGNHLGVVTSQSKVEYILDEPFAVYRRGFLIDVPGAQYRSRDLATGNWSYGTGRLLIHAGSALESYIWQESAMSDAVGTVRGIQYARELGIEVLDGITSENWATEGPKLSNNTTCTNHTTADVAAIYDWVNDGYTVSVPRCRIEYGEFAGAVWMAERVDGAFGALISGGYNGGYTTGAPPITYAPNEETGWDFAGPTPPANPEPGDPPEATPPEINSGQGNGITRFTVTAGDPVNMVTGNLVHTERDIVLKGRSLPVVFERTYNSRSAVDGPLGYGWTHAFNHSLRHLEMITDTQANLYRHTMSWTDGTGSQKFFTLDVPIGSPTSIPCGTSTFTNPAGFYVLFKRETDCSYTIREKNGLTYRFESFPDTAPGTATGKLLSITDRNGNVLTLEYSQGGELAKVWDTLNRQALTLTSTNGRITAIQDLGGRQYEYVYDGDKLVAFKNPLARDGKQPPVTYSYYDDATLNYAMRRYTLPRGNGMTFEYYMNGMVFRHINDLGEASTFTYNEFRRERTVVNERGHARKFFFDQHGNPTKIVEENGGERIYTYDTAHPMNRIAKRDPMGYTTQYCYDSAGNVTRIIPPPAMVAGTTCEMQSPTGVVEYRHFDAFNQPRTILDAAGNCTIQKFDTRGNLDQVLRLTTAASAMCRQSGFDPVTYTPTAGDLLAWTINTYDTQTGVLLSRKQVREVATQVGPYEAYTYDTNKLNVIGIVRYGDKDGNGSLDTPDEASLAYDSLDRLTQGLTAAWYPTTFEYDALDRVIRGTDALGQLRDYAFDANGNLAGERLLVDGALVDQRSFDYDLADRRVRTTNAGGYATTTEYDPRGNPVRIVNPDGYSLTFDYDPNNTVIRAADQEGNTVSRTLDLDGKPRTVTDPNGSTTTLTYYGPEREGRLQEQKNALNHATSYDYDATGNRIRVTDALDRTTLTVYDALTRPVRVVGPVYPEGGSQRRPVTQYTYTLLGTLQQVAAGWTTNLDGSEGADTVTPQMTYTHDDFGRTLTARIGAAGPVWSFVADRHGNVVTATDPRGVVTTVTYGYGGQLLAREAQLPGGLSLLPLTQASRSQTTGYTPVYRGGICRAGGGGGCLGWDARLEPGLGPRLGYLRTTGGAEAQALYRGPCYSDPWGTCTAWSLTTETNGTAVGYARLTNPGGSENVPFRQSGGLWLQGTPGGAEGYLWPAEAAVTQRDHVYVTTEAVPAAYAPEGLVGYLRQTGGEGTASLQRFVDTATGTIHTYGTGDAPSGYSLDATLGYLNTATGDGRVALYRYKDLDRSATLLSTAATAPTGYTDQTLLGYLYLSHPEMTAVRYVRNPLGQVTLASTPTLTTTYTYDPAHRLQSVTDSRGTTTLTYTYTPGGHLRRVQDSDGGITDYTYDPAGRPQALWTPSGEVVVLAYDPGGRRTDTWFPNGVHTAYTYVADNTLQRV